MLERNQRLVFTLGILTMLFTTACAKKDTSPEIIRAQSAHTINAKINFAVIGDYGKDNSDEQKVAALVDRNNPEFIITVGDNNYRDGCMSTIDDNIGKYFQKYIYNYKGKYGKGSKTQRFYPSLGNHDWRAQEECPEEGGLPYELYFDLPGNERYYDFVKGPVHFFALDSDWREPDGNQMNSKQYRWFKETIGKSKSPIKIAFFHHPPYSSGEHGNESDMQWDFAALGVDLVLAGHDHMYERIERDGITYVVNGLGGASIYQFEDKVEGSKITYNEKHGAVFIEATENTVTAKLINADDETIDEFVIKKKSDTTESDE